MKSREITRANKTQNSEYETFEHWRSHIDTRGQKETCSTAEDMEEAVERKRKDKWLRDRGGIGCRGQGSLEAESLHPNSLLGERTNGDDDDDEDDDNDDNEMWTQKVLESILVGGSNLILKGINKGNYKIFYWKAITETGLPKAASQPKAFKKMSWTRSPVYLHTYFKDIFLKVFENATRNKASAYIQL